jgi:hypothetical protein
MSVVNVEKSAAGESPDHRAITAALASSMERERGAVTVGRGGNTEGRFKLVASFFKGDSIDPYDGRMLTISTRDQGCESDNDTIVATCCVVIEVGNACAGTASNIEDQFFQ